MEVKINIPFNELVTVIKQLSPAQKAKIQQELNQDSAIDSRNSRLTELLLTGPVFTEEQIKTIEETSKSINQWRTKPL